MLFARCRCGKRHHWDSGMPPVPCQICKNCGSTLSYSPNGHVNSVPHEYEWRYNRYTGKKEYMECTLCGDVLYPEPNVEDTIVLNE